MENLKFSQKWNWRKRKKERKKERKEQDEHYYYNTLQELLQCEEDSFIPDDLDDKFYDDNTYNWEVMFETVRFFLMKEGRWPRWEGKRTSEM